LDQLGTWLIVTSLSISISKFYSLEPMEQLRQNMAATLLGWSPSFCMIFVSFKIST